MPSSAKPSERLRLRIMGRAQQVLEAAAAVAHCSLTEFVLRSALERANEVLADRRAFSVSAEKWKAFLAAFDAPPRPLPCLSSFWMNPDSSMQDSEDRETQSF